MRDWEPIREICNEATSGDWVVDKSPGMAKTVWSEKLLVAEGLYLSDADFITTARTALPEAIAEIERLRVVIKGIHGHNFANTMQIQKEKWEIIEQLRQEKAEQTKLAEQQIKSILIEFSERANEDKELVNQLAQEKAELVNVLKDLIRIRVHFISKRDFDLLESLPDTWEQAKELTVRHGGEPK